jgi:glycosyltransferase involved in cell wall biosynthesis
MGFGNCVVTHDTPENLETVGPVGFSYSGSTGAESLAPLLQRLIDDPELVARRRAQSLAYVRRRYSWEAITDQYLALFSRVLTRYVRPGARVARALARWISTGSRR